MLREMLTGYKIKDRFRELSETYNFKRRNVLIRQKNDRELQQAQDQVINPATSQSLDGQFTSVKFQSASKRNIWGK